MWCNEMMERLGESVAWLQKLVFLFFESLDSQVDSCMFKCCIRVLLPRKVLSSYWSSDLEEEEEAVNCEMAVKWALNAVSTGAHIMKGKVLCNRMVDLQLR